jgi:hypothetical protein
METQAVSITSRFSQQNAVKRLSAAADYGRGARGLTPRIAGEVSAERVYVYRHRPFARNGIYPGFTGSFSTVDGRTVLKGVLTDSASSLFAGGVYWGGLIIVSAGLMLGIVFQGAGWSGVLGLIAVGILTALLYAWSIVVAANVRIDGELLVEDLKRILN